MFGEFTLEQREAAGVELSACTHNYLAGAGGCAPHVLPGAVPCCGTGALSGESGVAVWTCSPAQSCDMMSFPSSLPLPGDPA